MYLTNQNAVVGKLVYNKDGIEIWKTTDKNNSKKGWLGIFNRTETQKQLSLTAKDLDFGSSKTSLFDVWNNKNLTALSDKNPVGNTVNGNGVIFCRYSL